MKKINAFLNLLIAVLFGVFAGMTLENYLEYRAYPQIYEAQSAPWYCYGALYGLILFLAGAAVCVVLKLVFRRKNR